MQPYRDRLRSLLLLPPLLLLGMGDCTLVSVDLSIVRPDADGDGEVTAADQAVLAGCEGLDPGSVPACALADGDRDGDVDAADAAAVDAALGERVCNGFVELCDRPLDQVAFATAHNAYSAVDDGFRLGPTANHFQGIAEQLPAGVRGLMLDVLRWEDPFDPDDAEQLWLCHGVCDLGTFALGAIPLVDGLATIRDFLEARPGEVVVLLFEIVDPADEAIPKQGPDIGEDEVEAAFAEAGLLPAPGTGLRPHVHTPGQPWATLAELVDADERLVVLTQDRQDVPGSVPWYHYLWDDLAWDTPFTARSADDFSCRRGRGSTSNDLFVLNHFVTPFENGAGEPVAAAAANANPGLFLRALQCWADSGRFPNFVTVDFWSQGDLLQTVDTLNRIAIRDGTASPF